MRTVTVSDWRSLHHLTPLAWMFLGAVWLAGCQGTALSEEREKEIDEETRQENYETAGFTFYDGGAYAKAESMFDKALVKKPRDKKLRRALARAKIQQGTPRKLREAQKILEPLMDMEWRNADGQDRKFEVISDMATVHTELADYYDRDIRELEERARTDPDADSARVRRQIQRQVRTRNELLQDAIPMWRQVLNLNHRNPYALAGLAKANLQLSRDSEGMEYAREYLELTKDSQPFWEKKIKDLEEARGKHNVTNRQRTHWRKKAYSARNKQMKMHMLLATVHMRRQEYREAIDQYSRALHIDESQTAAYLERGQALAAEGRHILAVKDLREYMRRTDPEAQRGARVKAAELLQKYRKIIADGETRERNDPIPVSPPATAPQPAPPSGGGFPVPTPPSSGSGGAPTPIYDDPGTPDGFPR